MTTIKTDRKGFPFINLRDRLRKPEQRLFLGIQRGDVDLLKAFIESGSFGVDQDVKRLRTREETSEQRWNRDHYRPDLSEPYSKGEDSGQGLLHYIVTHAPAAKEEEMMMYLLSKGANPNKQTFFRETPLHYAAYNDNVDLLALLVGYGGDLTLHMSSRSSFAEDDPYCPTPIQLLKEELKKEYEGVAEEKLTAIFQKKYLTQTTIPAPHVTGRASPRL